MPSRYGPGVLPESLDLDLGAVARAFMAGRDRKHARRREQQHDVERGEDRARTRESHDLNYYERGGRRGTPPADRGHTVEFPPEPNFPSFGEALRVAEAAPPEPDVLDPASFGPALGKAFRTMGPRGGPSAPMEPSPLEAPVELMGSPMGAPGGSAGGSESTAIPATRHPGAFDPATRTFGGSPMQMAVTAAHTRPGAAGGPGGGRRVDLGPTGRYTTIDDSHYIDELATPAAERAADREGQMNLASALRILEIGARGEQASGLEEQRQKNRLELRDRINAGNIAGILKRAEAGGRPATAGQVEANANKAADGIIAAAQGDYNKAKDWLENTEEGRDFAKHGLARRHLLAAFGRYETATTTRATMQQTGPLGVPPADAVRNVQQTRTEVRGSKEPALTPAPKDGAAPPAAAPATKRTITQQQYDQAIAAGHADSAIAAAYDIPAGVKRKAAKK